MWKHINASIYNDHFIDFLSFCFLSSFSLKFSTIFFFFLIMSVIKKKEKFFLIIPFNNIKSNTKMMTKKQHQLKHCWIFLFHQKICIRRRELVKLIKKRNLFFWNFKNKNFFNLFRVLRYAVYVKLLIFRLSSNRNDSIESNC